MSDLPINDFAASLPGEEDGSIWPTLLFLAVTLAMTLGLLLGAA